jgi:hypothetical protein
MNDNKSTEDASLIDDSESKDILDFRTGPAKIKDGIVETFQGVGTYFSNAGRKGFNNLRNSKMAANLKDRLNSTKERGRNFHNNQRLSTITYVVTGALALGIGAYTFSDELSSTGEFIAEIPGNIAKIPTHLGGAVDYIGEIPGKFADNLETAIHNPTFPNGFNLFITPDNQKTIMVDSNGDAYELTKKINPEELERATGYGANIIDLGSEVQKGVEQYFKDTGLTAELVTRSDVGVMIDSSLAQFQRPTSPTREPTHSRPEIRPRPQRSRTVYGNQ